MVSYYGYINYVTAMVLAIEQPKVSSVCKYVGITARCGADDLHGRVGNNTLTLPYHVT